VPILRPQRIYPFSREILSYRVAAAESAAYHLGRLEGDSRVFIKP
jgi:hypothetical protein